MAVNKLRVFLDQPTFYAIASNELDELHFPVTRTWKGKLLKNPHDTEGNPEPKVFFSFVGNYIKGTEHHMIERYILAISPSTVKAKKFFGLISVKYPYLTVKLGNIVPMSDSRDSHLDENIGRVTKWQQLSTRV